MKMETDPSVQFGKVISHPSPEDEVVLTGISGAFPKADDIDELVDALENKKELLTKIPPNPELPPRFGLMNDITRFDNGFFGVSMRHTITLNPLCKLLLEKCYEAIFDAGLHPSDLEGTNTGVFIGICLSEHEHYWFTYYQQEKGNIVMGNQKSVYANTVSHHLKLKGPSFVVDTACSSSAMALDAAYRSMRLGQCESALVASANTISLGGFSLQFARLGMMLSPDGRCKPFDVDGTGYVRSEAATAVLLQKAKDSHRIYANLVHMKTNSDGYTDQGITFPSGESQYQLFKEIYLESGVNPVDVEYVEAHGTGTSAGDPEEMITIDKIFTPGRKNQLMVGSVKSNIGHTESAAFLCNLIKLAVMFQTNTILPTINYKIPKPSLNGIIEGRIKIVVDNIPHPKGNALTAMSCFGFGGSNGHAIVKKFWKTKPNRAQSFSTDLPRLVCVSGRTENAVELLLNDVGDKLDEEHIALIHNIFRKPVNNHIFRGFVIVSNKGILEKSVSRVRGKQQSQLYLYLGGSCQLNQSLLPTLLNIPILGEFRTRVTNFLNKKDLDLDFEGKGGPTKLFYEALTQAACIKLLNQLQIQKAEVLAFSFGHLVKALYENSLDLEEFLELVYSLSDSQQHYSKLLNDSKRNQQLLKAVFHDARPKFERLVPPGATVLHLGTSPTWNVGRYNSLSFNSASTTLDVLNLLGRLFEAGLQPQVQYLYPKVQFPVSLGTPMISSKIKWQHSRSFFTPSCETKIKQKQRRAFDIDLNDSNWAQVEGHNIDGRILFPATNYLYLAWGLLADMLEIDLLKTKVVFENCRFLRACTLNKTSLLKLRLSIAPETGNFEITEDDAVVVTGTIKHDEDIKIVDTAQFVPDEDIVMQTKDIYKELKLRGYYYNGVFKSLTACNMKATHGEIKWRNDWVAFMDNMLQIKILGVDTRQLYVPTSIAKLAIDPQVHLKRVESLKTVDNDTGDVDMPISHNYGVIRAGGVEIRGLIASPLRRKKELYVPVLEKQVFVPNLGKLTIEQALRVFMQVALENSGLTLVKVVEVHNDQPNQLAGPIIKNVLEDLPLIKADITVLSPTPIETELKVENKKLSEILENTVVIATNLLSNSNIEQAVKATAAGGFIISREPLASDLPPQQNSNLQLLNVYETDSEKLVLLRKADNSKSQTSRVFVNVSDRRNFQWLENLKNVVAEGREVVVWSQNEPLNGIVGLVNCIRREPNSQNARCLFINTPSPDFDPAHPFYKTQLDKGLAVNILKNGTWGTLRHLLLSEINEKENEHCFANLMVKGDLSSIKWVEGPLTRGLKTQPNEEIVQIHYSSLNFRDVMTATGRVNADSKAKDGRRQQEVVQGLEFSGVTLSGKRVMGMVAGGSLATLTKVNKYLLWDVPKEWSLEEAATVPVVYGTCLFALVEIGKIKPYHSVLIHSGTGGVGQAAINLCLKWGCTIFTTVGTEEKRKYILENFPQIKATHIGNSRDISFEQMVMKQTKGRGVDIILNSLAEEKLQTSVRCLAPNGKFLEIGKFDLGSDNRLPLINLSKGRSFHGVMVDMVFTEADEFKLKLYNLLAGYIASGAVKPLKTNVFQMDDVQQAFRFMATGQHMGKVLVQIRQDTLPAPYKGTPRFFCQPNESYVICGGLGGFGMELADWLVLRGANNLVLSSRKGVVNGYQRYRISLWELYGCRVKVFTQDITTKTGCEALIKEANSLGPVAGVFNLAVVLQDATLPNQTQESFEVSFRPKAYATQYLDEITRTSCPNLKNFVVFSSVSCGRGNGGQTNYGMANSVMERICEQRRNDGHPAVAIQWGVIGDVGLVAAMEESNKSLEIGGTLSQSISNCLQVLDTLLKQDEAAVVSSMVVAEKKIVSNSGNVLSVVLGIIGIRDLKAVSMNSALSELGMDSMNGVEIKQTLERDFNIFLTPVELRTLTLSRIVELSENKDLAAENDQPSEFWSPFIKELLDTAEQIKSIVQLSDSNQPGPRIVIFPGIEGVCNLLRSMTPKLKAEVYGVNYVSSMQQDTISKMVDSLIPELLEILPANRPFHIMAHSVGCNVALETVSRLESLGRQGTVTFIDGSPEYMRLVIKLLTGSEAGEDRENLLLGNLMRTQLTGPEANKALEEIRKLKTLPEKFRVIMEHFKTDERMTETFVVNAMTSIIKRIDACWTYQPTFTTKLKAQAKLVKPQTAMIDVAISDDYGLGQYFEKPLEVETLPGTHTTILENESLAEAQIKLIGNWKH